MKYNTTHNDQSELMSTLEAERQRVKLSYREFAPSIGLPWSTYANWVNGQRRLGALSLLRIQRKRPECFTGPLLDRYMPERKGAAL